MGGGERVAIHSMLSALKLGHEVTLLSEAFDAGKFEDFFGCYGLFNNVHKLTYPPFKPLVGRGLLLYQRLFYYQTKFRQLLSKDREFGLVLGTQDVGYVPSTRVPVVQYCYFPEYFRHLQLNPSSQLWRLYYAPARIYYRDRVRLIEELLSVSDFTREFIRQIWSRDSTTLYPPCPVEFYGSLGAQRENLAVTIGRMVPEKRIDLFVELARRLPEFKFVIIGSVAGESDAYYSSLKSKGTDNISIVLSPLRKVKDILARAKIYVHCAENEHFGITIVEAMAAGCVPVVHDSGGPREIVTQSVGYRWRDIPEAVDLIRRVMNDDALQTKLSQASVEKAKLFNPEVFETGLSRVLERYEK